MRLVHFSILLFLSSVLQAQNFNSAKLDSILTILEINNKAMGSLSIFKNGKEVYTKSIGYKDSFLIQKASAKTIYKIGSISKTYTATLILMLKEKGKLSLSDKLSNWFPEIKNADEITIEHLLRHRSGLFNFSDDFTFTKWMEKPIERKDLLGKITAYTTSFKPGDKFDYSNTNYFLLTLIAEKISGKKYNQLVYEWIKKPLKLKRTFAYPDRKYFADEAVSFQKFADWNLSTNTNMSVTLGAGSVTSTATELNIFLHGLFSNQLLTEKTIDEMVEMVDGYGLGVLPATFNQKKAIGHNGGIDGFRSMGFYFRDEQLSISYLSNAVDFPINEILIATLSIYFNKSYDYPVFKEKPSLYSSIELLQFEGIYICSQLPFSFTLKAKGNLLTLKPSHQSEVVLEEKDKNIFEYKASGLLLEFSEDKSKLIMKQGFGTFEFKKQTP